MAHGLADILAYQGGSRGLGRRTERRKPTDVADAGTATRGTTSSSRSKLASMPSSKAHRRRGAIQRKIGIAKTKNSAAVSLRGVDAAVAKLRTKAQAGAKLSEAQLRLLNKYGGIWPQRYD